MFKNYQVIFSGKLQPGQDAAHVINLFSEKTDLERGKVELLIRRGRPIILKKGLDRVAVEKYLMVLRYIGLVVESYPKLPEAAPVVPKAPTVESKVTVPPVVHEATPAEPKGSEVTPVPPKVYEPPPVVPKASNNLDLEYLDNGGDDITELLDPDERPCHCPECGSDSMEMGICQACGIVASKYQEVQTRQAASAQDEACEEEDSANPYTAPETDRFETPAVEMSEPGGEAVGNGIAGFGQVRDYFQASALAWILAIVAMVAWFVISFVVGIIPLSIGGLIFSLVGPMIMAGFLLGCRE